MNYGLFSVFLVGLLWCATGITVTSARRAGCSIPGFYLAGSLLALLPTGGVLLLNRTEEWDFPAWGIAILSAGSLLNGLGQAVTMWNLRGGSCALAFAVPQLGFIIPFLCGGILWGERMTLPNLAGLAVSAAAVLLAMSPEKGRDFENRRNFRRIATALCAMVLVGTGQAFVMYPSLPGNGAVRLPPAAGTFVILLANGIFFSLLFFAERMKSGGRSFSGKEMLRLSGFGAAWGILAASSYFALFAAMRIMGRSGRTGVVFPVACVTAILIFTVFTLIRLREPLSARRSAALILIGVGIVLIRLS